MDMHTIDWILSCFHIFVAPLHVGGYQHVSVRPCWSCSGRVTMIRTFVFVLGLTLLWAVTRRLWRVSPWVLLTRRFLAVTSRCRSL